jgi:mannose-6-phosphate isomerase-like protein (cupin superfamily)
LLILVAMSAPGLTPKADVLPPSYGRDLPFIGTLRASAADTGGAFEIIEYRGPAVPPPHIHRDHDEIFYVLEGRFSFVLGNSDRVAEAGSLVWVPRGTRHGFTIEPGSTALLITQPSGLEGFFVELGQGLAEERSSDEIRAALAGKYDSIPAPAGD